MGAKGSIIDLKINSQTYRVIADSDFTQKTKGELKSTATSGAAIFALEKQVPSVEGVKIADEDGTARETLLALMGQDVSISFTEADGLVYSTPAGQINVKDRKSMDGILEIDLHPSVEFLIG